MEFILTFVCMTGVAVGLWAIVPTLNRVGILEEVSADLDRDLKEVEIQLAEALQRERWGTRPKNDERWLDRPPYEIE